MGYEINRLAIPTPFAGRHLLPANGAERLRIIAAVRNDLLICGIGARAYAIERPRVQRGTP